MSYRSQAVSPSVVPKTSRYQVEEEERYLSPARRLGVYNRRNTTPTIFDYSARGRIYDEEEEDLEDEFEDEGEYSRGTPVRSSPPPLYQPNRYRNYPRNTGYAPRRIEF